MHMSIYIYTHTNTQTYEKQSLYKRPGSPLLAPLCSPSGSQYLLSQLAQPVGLTRGHGAADKRSAHLIHKQIHIHTVTDGNQVSQTEHLKTRTTDKGLFTPRVMPPKTALQIIVLHQNYSHQA